MQGGFHILVATPGRLIDYAEKGQVCFSNLRFLVLDEADRMLDMGFKGDIEKILQNPSMTKPDKRQTLMFSATFPKEIQRLAGKYLRDYLFVAIGIVGGASSDVQQNVYQCSRYEKRKKLMELLDAEDPRGTIVFVETKRNADFLASFLSESKHMTTSIHGDRVQRQREQALDDFTRGKMKVLIGTSVCARGLGRLFSPETRNGGPSNIFQSFSFADIPGVRHVINYDLPKTIEDYVHRIGRTGRVGNEGKATSFFEPEQVGIVVAPHCAELMAKINRFLVFCRRQDGPLADGLVKILRECNQNVPDFLAVGGAGGAGGDGQNNQFGGRDIRNSAASAPAAHGGGGDDEEW